MAKKYGQYLVVEGYDLKSSIPKNGIGHIIEFDPHMIYVINLMTKKIVGSYHQEHLAHACGQFLDANDKKKTDKEMDDILYGE